MKHISSRMVAYTCLYCLVIFGIFIIQFKKGNTFSVTLGVLSITGRHEVSDSGAVVPLLPIHIISNGLDVYIDERNPAVSVSRNNKQNPLSIESYTEKDNGFSIHYSDKSVVSFVADKQKEIDIIRIEAALAEETEQIMLPWKITRNARIERENGRVFVKAGKKQYSFTENFGLTADIHKHNARLHETPRITLTKHHPLAYYRTNPPSKNFEFTAITGMPQASLDRYAKTLSAFTDAMVHNAENEIRAKTADEYTVAAFAAEMGRRNMPDAVFELLPVKSVPQNILTYRLNPFYNNLSKTYQQLAKAQLSAYNSYTGLIVEKNPKIFEKKDMIRLLFDRKGQEWLEKLVDFSKTIDVSLLTVRQAAGILAVNTDLSHFYPNAVNIFEPLCIAAEKKIKDSFFLIDGKLYISDDGKTVNTVESLEIAHILITYGTQKDTVWQAAGRILMSSLLVYSGESASLPAGFIITGGETDHRGLIVNDSSMLNAGTLYPLVFPDTSWYPHVKSLALQAEPGIWAWTCAQNIEVIEKKPSTLTFRVRFPVGSTHYITLNGIRPFTQIELYGVPFRSDQRFELYNSSGYVYNDKDNVLYLKMFHKNEYETVRLSFKKQEPPRPAARSVKKPAAQPKPAAPAETEEASTVKNEAERSTNTAAAVSKPESSGQPATPSEAAVKSADGEAAPSP